MAGRAHQAARLDAKLLEVEEEDVDVGSKIVGDILADLLASVVGEDKATSCEGDTQEKDAEKEEVSGEQREERRRERREAVPVAVVEIDCTSPDITVRREGKRGEEGEERSEECSSCTVEGGEEGRRRSSRSLRTGEESRSGKRSSLRRRGGKRTVRSGKDARARFKSSEDLIHRLYVCISGAADQLQTNFAGDFRSILKYVFLMNSTPDEEEEEEESPEEEEEEEEEQSPESLSLDEGGEEEGGEGATGRDSTTPTGQGGRRGYSLGEDALMSETEQSYLRTFPEPTTTAATTGEGDPGGIHTRLLSTSPPAGLAAMPVYASNLGEQFLHFITARKL